MKKIFCALFEVITALVQDDKIKNDSKIDRL